MQLSGSREGDSHHSHERTNCHSDSHNDGSTRKMRMRAGHRSSVTRIIGQIDEAIETSDAQKLRQFQQSLFKKSDILAQLDEELLNEGETEQLEYEIEQADIVMEKLNLALSAIKEALETISTEGKEGVQHNRKPQTHQSTPESEDNDHSPSPPAVTSDLTATTSANQTCKFTSLIPDRFTNKTQGFILYSW